MPPLRPPCPPAACLCGRAQLLADPAADIRILQLTRTQEQRLITRLENISSLADLKHLQARMLAQLGLVVHIRPSQRVVRSLRGILIQVEARPGVCRKIRQSLPAAIRRGLARRPEIAYAILNEHDLLGLSDTLTDTLTETKARPAPPSTSTQSVIAQ